MKMSAQRFFATNATDALRRIKAELGGDAVVLSSSEVNDGIEFMAIAAKDLVTMTTVTPAAAGATGALAAASLPLRGPEAATRPSSVDRTSAGQTPMLLRSADPAPQSEQPRERQRASLQSRSLAMEVEQARAARGPASISQATLAAAPAPAVIRPATQPGSHAESGAEEAQSNAGFGELSSQMAEVKQLLSGHLATNYWGTLQQRAPAQAQLTRHLLNAGLSSAVVSRMLAELPDTADFDALTKAAQGWVQAQLKVSDAFELFERGGVYAFIGPTGVGKTTTLAKIAARCVMRYGRRQVALLTTDTYRIGAQEQLRLFARILGLPVVALRDSDDMESKLAELSSRKIVLLDTAGVSQRDTMMVDQLNLIRRGCGNVHRVLVMSATTSTRTMDDVVASHKTALGGQGLHSAIVTKMDEGMSLAPAIDCVLRHDLPLLFLSNGQRVPEDLFAADAAYVSHRTVYPRGGDATEADEAHMPAMLVDDLGNWGVAGSNA
jgi:flagellar biosynthesis protein FlhF